VRWLPRAPRTEERLLWSRDERFIAELAERIPNVRLINLASGAVLIGSGEFMTDTYIAARSGLAPYGLVPLDPALPEPERYLTALAEAVQQSGIADRIGMLTSPVAGYHKVMDAFLARREVIQVQYQPLVTLRSLEAVAYETLCRPSKAVGSIDEVVAAAVATDRTLDLDRLVVERVLARTARLESIPGHITVNVLPASLADAWFEPKALAERCRAAGIRPGMVTLECTEQQSTPDQAALVRRVRQLRRQGFGFAVDDAGAGYASFALIAALRPSLIKIDREIVHGLSRTQAKQALVEAFVGFARRIGAQLAAEGIERNADLAALRELGVELGQGYLLGRPANEPQPARRPRPRSTSRVGVAPG
jgi:EAL domain-containing protein (putative c-di-GMP-specific phosphodiesterase class I)